MFPSGLIFEPMEMEDVGYEGGESPQGRGAEERGGKSHFASSHNQQMSYCHMDVKPASLGE